MGQPPPPTVCHNCPERRPLLVMPGDVSYCPICDLGIADQRKENQ